MEGYAGGLCALGGPRGRCLSERRATRHVWYLMRRPEASVVDAAFPDPTHSDSTVFIFASSFASR